MSEVKPLSFQLSEEMLGILRDEFNPNKIVTKFSESLRIRTVTTDFLCYRSDLSKLLTWELRTSTCLGL